MSKSFEARQLLERARELREQGEFDSALSLIDRALKLDTTQHTIWREQGDLLSVKHEFEEAKAAYTHALAIEPCAAAWAGKAEALHRLGYPDEARRAAERSLAIDVDNARAWWAQVAIAYSPRNFLAMLAAANEALRHSRAEKQVNVQALLAKCTALNYLNRYWDALVAADEVLHAAPENAWAWRIRGQTLDKLRRYEEALAASEWAVTLQPRVSLYWADKGFALYRLRRHRESAEAYAHALLFEPINRDFMAKLAGACLRSWQLKQAFQAFRLAIRIEDYQHALSRRSNGLIILRH
jgi:tetratricopeptide (TPR) repeat protein